MSEFVLAGILGGIFLLTVIAVVIVMARKDKDVIYDTNGNNIQMTSNVKHSKTADEEFSSLSAEERAEVSEVLKHRKVPSNETQPVTENDKVLDLDEFFVTEEELERARKEKPSSSPVDQAAYEAAYQNA